MKSKIKKGIVIFLIGYLVLFSARVTCVLVRPDRATSELQLQNAVLSDAQSTRTGKNNYASSKMIVTSSETAKTITVDQKYERIGFLFSRTEDFDNDNAGIRNIIKEDSAVIQLENNSGIKGRRVLELSIGVHPDKFDSFVEKAKNIGELYDFRVEKIDKTSEYKNLKAQLATLEKTRASFISLKEKGGSISDLIGLENRILEIEEKVQSMGVQLGDYNEENELCTVKVTLNEKGIAAANIYSLSFILNNILESIVWSLSYYLLFLFILLLSGICAYVFLIVIVKGKVVYSSMMKSKQTNV